MTQYEQYEQYDISHEPVLATGLKAEAGKFVGQVLLFGKIPIREQCLLRSEAPAALITLGVQTNNVLKHIQLPR